MLVVFDRRRSHFIGPGAFAYNPRLPTLQNTDGEPLSLHKLVFDLYAPPQTAFDALKHLALDEMDEDLLVDATRDCEDKLTRVRLSWKKRGNEKHAGWDNTVLGWIEIDGPRLIAEVNSQARADAIRKTIETALGEDVRYRASEIQSPERMLADLQAAGGVGGGAASEEHNRLAELPEVREKISAMMAAHWEHWVDQPIPILGNRTPMEAVKDPDGREIVESLVMQAERTGRSPNLPTDEAMFRRLRERLLTGSLVGWSKPYSLYGYQPAELCVERLSHNSLSALAARIAQGVTTGEQLRPRFGFSRHPMNMPPRFGCRCPCGRVANGLRPRFLPSAERAPALPHTRYSDHPLVKRLLRLAYLVAIAGALLPFLKESGRGEWIRTTGLYVPNVALYQAKLHPEEVGPCPCLSSGGSLSQLSR